MCLMLALQMTFVEKQTMSVINILVQDSYYTHEIAENLRKFFGEKIVCYEDQSPDGIKIDVFVLSGFNVLRSGPAMLSKLRSRIGSKKSKIIVTSADDAILDEIKSQPEFEVDFTIQKSKIVVGLMFADRGSRKDSKKRVLSDLLLSLS